MLSDPVHLYKFEHDSSSGLQEVNIADLQNVSAQNYLLVLDLEGKVEILEFPVMMIATKTLKVVDYFHRFVGKGTYGTSSRRAAFVTCGNWDSRRAAFVTCGNWDLKTKASPQSRVSSMRLPPYFIEWINLKDVYLNFNKRWATEMMTMMIELNISSFGSHHLGMDDTKNIVRVLQCMLADGAQMQITAKRSSGSPGNVTFLFKNWI